MFSEIIFQPDSLSVSWAGESIPLLPREFALLRFLWLNYNQLLSREQLLDAVWFNEDPIDRTVDDHIYRLRKKLEPWDAFLKIETVRGTGYRLIFREPENKNPLMSDMTFTNGMKKLWEQYLLYGQGKAIQLLAEHHDILGFPVDIASEVYLHFMRGDFSWVVDCEIVPFREKLFYLLHIYYYVQFNVEKALDFYQRALAQQALPKMHFEELKLNIALLYLESGRFEEAGNCLNQFRDDGLVDEGISLYFHSLELILYFLREDGEKTEAKLRTYEKMLADNPYQREAGVFKIIHGLWFLKTGDRRKGEEELENGLQTLKQSQFVPHYIVGVRMIIIFLNRYVIYSDPETKTDYKRLWLNLYKKFNFAHLEMKIEKLLIKNL